MQGLEKVYNIKKTLCNYKIIKKHFIKKKRFCDFIVISNHFVRYLINPDKETNWITLFSDGFYLHFPLRLPIFITHRSVIYLCSFLPHSSALTIASFCLSKLKSAQIDVYEKYPCWTEDQNFKINQDIVFTTYGNTGCRVFKGRIQNWKYFWLKINILKRNYWILKIGLMGRCLNLTLKVNF